MDAYIQNTQEWILVAMIMLQNHGRIRPTEIQAKIATLSLGKSINVNSILEEHNMDVSVLGVKRTPPCVFFECDGGTWYVNKIRIQQCMLFNMDQLYELFVYRVAALIFGNKVTYQKMGNYMVSRVSDGKRFVCLRPDLTLKVSDAEQWIIDTKWKMPNRFAKESDIYQMNAYSSAIKDVNKVILLYPRVAKTDKLVGSYSFISATGINKPLEIKVIDLMECLSWSDFLKSFKSSIIT